MFTSKYFVVFVTNNENWFLSHTNWEKIGCGLTYNLKKSAKTESFLNIT